jgi:hypothetical protein
MKKLNIIILSLLLGLGFSTLAIASAKSSKAVNISYCKRAKTFLGTKYSTYDVRCSDGLHYTISTWNERKEWCQGNERNDCVNSQLKAANKACRS